MDTTDPSEDRRYARQELLPDFGRASQRRLAVGHAVIVGCGALGCVSADLLVRAGVGRVTLIDRDIVEPTNLQRQSLYTEADVAEGLPKVEAAKRRLSAVNSGIEIVAHASDLTPANARRLTEAADVLVDGTDNFETRFILNDLAVERGTPYVYGGAVGTRGMAFTVLGHDERQSGRLPCVRCLFPEPPPPGSQPTCDTAGVLGTVVAMVGAYQAGEALKLLIGRSDLVMRSLLDFDPWNGERRRLDLNGTRSGKCRCCVERRFDFLDAKRGGGTATLCGRDAVQVSPVNGAPVDLEALHARIEPIADATLGPFTVRLTLESGVRLTVFRDGRAMVQGVTDPAKARAIYDRVIGG
ncbi:MAG: ThiF family adenylyltransferase [Planctomycetota bacterium]